MSAPSRIALVLLAAAMMVAAGSTRSARQAPIELCGRDSVDQRLGPSRSLYCIDLVPVPDFREASGTVELHHASSPFTVSVDAEGHHRYEVVIDLRGLPDPRSLGPYSTYVAWVTTPSLSPELKLGEVRAGRTRSGVVGFNKFIVMITAESSSRVTRRTGRMVLRANSPSWLLQPHDASKLPARSTDEHAHQAPGGSGWTMPPMHRDVPSMVAGLELLSPSTAPWRPGARTDTSRIPMVRPRELITLRDGDSLALSAGLVRRSIAGRTITMYGFNGQSPGPLLQVLERSTITVNFNNQLDQPTSIHWHGIRLDNRFDGVPHLTQPLVEPGGRFR